MEVQELTLTLMQLIHFNFFSTSLFYFIIEQEKTNTYACIHVSAMLYEPEPNSSLFLKFLILI